jgi:hypothetical protein
VTVVAIVRLVFDVGGIDGNLSRLFFGRSINVFVGHGFGASGFAQYLGDGLREGRLSVIDVTDRSDVHVGFAAIEFGGKATA